EDLLLALAQPMAKAAGLADAALISPTFSCHLSPSPSRQQQLEILAAQACQHTVIAGDDGVGKLPLTFLKFENFFFDAIAGDEPVCEYIACLPDAVTAVDGLRLKDRKSTRLNSSHVS